MTDKVDICLLDESNNRIEEINMKKPKTYKELLSQLNKNLKRLPNDFYIFYLTISNKPIVITNDKEYLTSKDILFIRKKQNKDIEQSMYESNYNKLTESKQEFLDTKFNCYICDSPIKKEKPYFCYICQKIFHCKCLNAWNEKKQHQNENLNCPNCRNELPIDQWKQKLDFDEDRTKAAEFIDKMNQIELDNNLNNNLNAIKEKRIKELKNDNIRLNEKINQLKNEEEKMNQLKNDNLILNDKITKLKNEGEKMNKLKDENIKLNEIINQLKTEGEKMNQLKSDNIKLNEIINQLKKESEKMNKLKDENIKQQNEQINQLKDINNRQSEMIDDYYTYIKQSSLVFKNILYKINEIATIINPGTNNQLLNLIGELSSGLNKPSLENISKVVFNDFEIIQKFIRNIKNEEEIKRRKEEMFEKMHEYKNEINLVYFCQNEGSENIFGSDFVKKNGNNLELIINGKKNVLTDKFTLKKGDNYVRMLIKNKLTNLSNMFNNCRALKNINDLQHLETKDVTDFSYMFWGCSLLSDISPIKNWYVTSGKNFQSMFGGCSSLVDISPLNIWKVGNGSNFSAMFFNCPLLYNIKALENWDVSNNTNFSGMFSKCKSLADIKPLQRWNVSKGNNFSAMFFECSSLSDISPLQNWDVSKGNIFTRMFCETKALGNSKLLSKWKISKENFNSMFV